MPNRLIRDDLMESERVLSLPVEARWLFVTILLQADDVGLFEATPFKLARKADVNRAQADKLLALLVDTDLVRLYEHAGKQYGFIPRFRQRLQLRRGKHPLPSLALVQDDEEAVNKINHLTANSTVNHGDSPKPTVAQPSKAEAEAEADKKNSPDKPVVRTAKPRAARKCPEAFEVTPAMAAWAMGEFAGMSTDGLQRETAKFRDHEFQSPKTDWPGAWRNWIRRAVENRGRAASAPVNKQEALEARNHEVAARFLANRERAHAQD